MKKQGKIRSTKGQSLVEYSIGLFAIALIIFVPLCNLGRDAATAVNQLRGDFCQRRNVPQPEAPASASDPVGD